MKRVLLGAAALGLLTSSCMPPPYRPPTADQPHATLKLRRVYEQAPGAQLIERAVLGGGTLLDQRAATELAGAPRTDGVLVHPRPAALEVSARFVHTESHWVTETYTEQEPYSTTETYSCGNGTSFQTCTRSVTRYRSVTKTRNVLRNVDVTDGACSRALYVAPAVGAAYLVDFTYRDNTVCTLSCIEQQPVSEGTFRALPCPAPTDEQMKHLREDD
jgi:hypothetical protein